MKTPKKSPAPRAAKPTSAKVKPTGSNADRYIGESHSYDSKRPKQPVRSRYQNGTGGAY